MDWFEAKAYLEHVFGVSHDVLHVIVGVCMQLLLAELFRVSVRSIWPLSIVFALEIANEWNDLHIASVVWPKLAVQWVESGKDLFLTMVLPSVILLAARFRPNLFH